MPTKKKPAEPRVFLTRVTCSNEWTNWAPSYALITLEPAFGAWAKKARAQVASAKAFDKDILYLAFWDGRAAYIKPDRAAWDEDDLDAVGDGSNLLLAQRPDPASYKQLGTDLNVLRVYEEGLVWVANVEDTTDLLETERFTWKELGVE